MLDFVKAHASDMINGTFELAGGCAILLSVLKLHKDKVVRGVSWPHILFFTGWGLWNLFYYPHLDQWFSLIGGIFLVAVNTAWMSQIIYWNFKERQ